MDTQRINLIINPAQGTPTPIVYIDQSPYSISDSNTYQYEFSVYRADGVPLQIGNSYDIAIQGTNPDGTPFGFTIYNWQIGRVENNTVFWELHNPPGYVITDLPGQCQCELVFYWRDTVTQYFSIDFILEVIPRNYIVFNGTRVTQISMDGTLLDAVVFNDKCVFGEFARFIDGETFATRIRSWLINSELTASAITSFSHAPWSDVPPSSQCCLVYDNNALNPSPETIVVWVETIYDEEEYPVSLEMYWSSPAPVVYLNDNSAKMFHGDVFASIRTINLSGIIIPRTIATIEKMFKNCELLETIYCNSFNLANTSYSQDVFLNCYNLVGGSGTAYDYSHRDFEYARIDDPTHGKPGYFTAPS